MNKSKILKNFFLLVNFVGFVALSGCVSSPSVPESRGTLDVARILKQVNESVAAAVDPDDKNFPPVSSVTLELQISVNDGLDVSTKFPAQLITSSVKVDESRLHRITLTFVPKPVPAPATTPATPTTATTTSAGTSPAGGPSPSTAPAAPYNSSTVSPASGTPAIANGSGRGPSGLLSSSGSGAASFESIREFPLTKAIRSIYKSVSRAGGNYKLQRGSITIQCALKLEVDAGGGGSVFGLVPISADGSTSNQTIQTLTLNIGTDPKSSTPGT